MTSSQDRAVTAVRAYFDACNSGDRSAFFEMFEGGGCHHLRKGRFGRFHD
ncbi:unnamed protein product, partial [Scytosiphon promiscuus]